MNGIHQNMTCPICWSRSVEEIDITLDMSNKRNERYYFECRQCHKKACSYCILEHFRKNKQNCPFCRYYGVREGISHVYYTKRGIKKVRWVYRSIISTWDDSAIDSSSNCSDEYLMDSED